MQKSWSHSQLQVAAQYTRCSHLDNLAKLVIDVEEEIMSQQYVASKIRNATTAIRRDIWPEYAEAKQKQPEQKDEKPLQETHTR